MYAAGLVGSALLGACNDHSNKAVAATSDNNVYVGGPPDEAILNFALNLEYLEAEYYLRAVTGNGLADSDRGNNPGMVIIKGSPQVDFSSNKLIGQYAAEIAQDELHHVQFLRAALGTHAASAPAIDLKNSFAALGNLIGVSNFDPFSSPENFLLGAFIFEDVGVTAYHGGAPFLKSRTYLDAAAGILAVEAYHAGLVRTFLTAADYNNGNTAFSDLTDNISGVRDSVDGNSNVSADYANGRPPVAANDDQGIGKNQAVGETNGMVSINGSLYAASNIVPTDANGLAYDRTIAQVHNIAYATAAQVSQGGFFPNGTNIPGHSALSMSADNSS
ncbi:ferritin-like domain-containing protein [Salinisphaera sp. RV14]|uniref:ferritin-like domain-containing protein n=1 Tax=Salinisphaera sp. RV14 TaxID=3454140 RepID=UPI003F87954F